MITDYFNKLYKLIKNLSIYTINGRKVTEEQFFKTYTKLNTNCKIYNDKLYIPSKINFKKGKKLW